MKKDLMGKASLLLGASLFCLIGCNPQSGGHAKSEDEAYTDLFEEEDIETGFALEDEISEESDSQYLENISQEAQEAVVVTPDVDSEVQETVAAETQEAEAVDEVANEQVVEVPAAESQPQLVLPEPSEVEAVVEMEDPALLEEEGISEETVLEEQVIEFGEPNAQGESSTVEMKDLKIVPVEEIVPGVDQDEELLSPQEAQSIVKSETASSLLVTPEETTQSLPEEE